MLHRGGVEVYTNNNFQYCAAKMYLSNTWQDVVPYIYTGGSWKKICAAGTTMDYFYTSDNQLFMTSDNQEFLVRRQ